MKAEDVINMYRIEYPNFNLDILSAKRLIAENNYEAAGERYRQIGKKVLKLRLNTFAIDYYLLASDLFVQAKKIEKAISTEQTIYEINRLSNNVNEMASSYEKIASYYTYYLKNDIKAGYYYFMSAKYHEENQNYFSAFKKARFACECYESSKNTQNKISAHSLACRMAMQSKYYERAGIYALKWLELVPRDYSSHYISICMKGYKSFLNTERTNDAWMLLNEILVAHYEKHKQQESITQYLKEAHKLYILNKNEVNIDYNKKFIREYTDDLEATIRYSAEFKEYSQKLGLNDVANFFYIQEQKNKEANYLIKKNKFKSYVYCIWNITSVYGTNLTRWLFTTGVVICFFGLMYSHYDFGLDKTSCFFKLMQSIKPSIRVSSSTADNLFSPFYYSVVTIATLGYGDITPSNLSGQIFSVIEVMFGYFILGNLVSIISKKFIR